MCVCVCVCVYICTVNIICLHDVCNSASYSVHNSTYMNYCTILHLNNIRYAYNDCIELYMKFSNYCTTLHNIVMRERSSNTLVYVHGVIRQVDTSILTLRLFLKR